MKKAILLSLSIVLSVTSWAQAENNFDGISQFLDFRFDQDSIGLWQVGKPDKSVFDSAASYPNVLVTDTASAYPPGADAAVYFKTKAYTLWESVFAIKWLQKLDIDSFFDGGIIEFSTDDTNFYNVYDTSLVYAFYGFDSSNFMPLQNGEWGFSGIDTTWREIWLCFQDLTWFNPNLNHDSVTIRFRFVSDSIDHGRDGWMMDNFVGELTWVHTIRNLSQKTKYLLSPNPTNGRTVLDLNDSKASRNMRDIQVLNVGLQVVQILDASQLPMELDLGSLSPGIYYLKLRSDELEEVIPFEILD